MTVAVGDIDELVRQTQALVRQIQDVDDVSPAFDAVQSGILDFERSEDVAVDVLIPSEAAAAGFLRVRSTRAFVFALICSERRVRDEIRVALETGPSAVVGTIVGLLTVSSGVAIALSAVSAIAVGIAALVLTKGLDGACAEASR